MVGPRGSGATAKGPYIFRLHGANYHQIGSLLPKRGKWSKFSQVYIYDTGNEVLNKMNEIGGHENDNSRRLDDVIVEELRRMIDQEWFEFGRELSFKLRLIEKRSTNGRTHNPPITSEVATLIPGDIDIDMKKRDVVLQTHAGELRRISELHPSHVPLQYSLLFSYSEDGYHLDVVHNDARNTMRVLCIHNTRISGRG
ncbi:hypothetical protein ACS0TY_007645 [Phlomoides rotata]